MIALPLLKEYNIGIRGLTKKPPCERLNYNKETTMSIPLCTVDGCDKQGRYKKPSMCQMHYRRYAKWGDVNYTKVPQEHHGMEGTPEYKVWCGIKRRCLNENDPSYANYGGRGVTICDEWLHSFKAFYDYIGKRPSAFYSIDRIDNNKGYEPNNVRWATKQQQSINRATKSDNSSGCKGVSFYKNTGKWVASITVHRKRIALGYFTDKTDAIKARKQAEDKYFIPLLTN